MNILIITPFYKNDRQIGSIRWDNISKRLSKNHNVIVVAQPLNEAETKMTIERDGNMIFARINQKTIYEMIAIKFRYGGVSNDLMNDNRTIKKNSKNPREGFVRKLKSCLFYSVMEPKAKEYARIIKKKVIPKGMKIDVVISSACPLIEMLFGYEVKKLLNCKWISDFRDWPYKTEIENDDIRRMKRMLQKTLPDADAITVVTKMGRALVKQDTGIGEEKIFTITNGYSKQDKRILKETDRSTLRLVHTGSVYGGKCKSDLLFQAIKILRDKESKANILFLCAGGENSSIIETAKRFDVLDVVKDKGFIPREDALDLQNSADCLVSLIHNDCGGGFNAKLLEYMLCGKPIINIACGNPEYGEATQVVNELKLGFAAEEANGEQEAVALADYLEIQAIRKKKGIPLLFEPDLHGIKKYDYDSITLEVEGLCEELMK